MVKKDVILLSQKLTDKAKEAFLLAIEVFNKPSIRYRAEGFSFFICNAWELMLKAHMLKTMGERSIYFKDNPERTLSLENCIARIFTNNKDPLRRNLEKILELRNTSTHFITEEYEMVYIPLFQACVFNFIENMYVFNLFCKYFGIKTNPKLCFVYNTFSQPQYTYSQQAIDFIVDEIRKDPEHIVDNLKNRVQQKS